MRVAIAMSVVVVVSGLLACGDSSIDASWVARVDGADVPLATLASVIDRQVERQPDADPEVLVARELNRLVNEQLALNRADQLGIEIGDDEISDRIRSIHGNGFPTEDQAYRETVRRTMRMDRAALIELVSGLRVEEPEINERFEKQREQLIEPEQVRVRNLVVADAARARTLRDQLMLDDADFGKLAQRHSLAPEAEHGGLLPRFGRGELPEAFDAAFALEPGELSEVIASPYGFHIFLVEEKLPQREVELEEVRSDLVAELQGEKLDELRRRWLYKLRLQAEIELNEPLLETLR